MLAVSLLAASSGSAAADIDHALYTDLLQRYTVESHDVAGTRVDYRGLAADPRWRTLTEQLEATRPEQLRARPETLAFWINAYNVLAIDLVIRHYPVESIRDIGSFFRPVWKRAAGTISGRVLSLAEIEHQILRPLGEPRIHVAIVCASTSCPSLAREPFEAERLEEQLDRAMRRFLASPDKGMRIDRAAGRIQLSAIFDWFEEDFEPAGGVLAYLKPYLSRNDRQWLARSNPRISYLDYDWKLNELTPKARARNRPGP